MFQAAILLALTVHQVPADSRPPTWSDSIEWTGNSPSDPVAPLKLGKFKISMERTTLKHVRTRIGSGTVSHNGDASESDTWLCYTIAHNELIWLSSSEIGGGKRIDGVSVARPEAVPGKRQDCPVLPSAYRPVRLDGGLWLGATEAEILERYGPPQKDGESWSYMFEGKHGKFDITSTLVFRIRKGSAIGIFQRRVTTY